MVQFFDGVLPLHRRGAVWKFFDVNKMNRTMQSGIFRPSPQIMLFLTPLWVNRPAGVIAAIRAFNHVTVKSHLLD